MGKILYPVGTQVVLRKYPEAGIFEVVDYIKGEKYPYRIENEYGDDGYNGLTVFSIKGLKRADSVSVKEESVSEDGSCSESPADDERFEQVLTELSYVREQLDLLFRAVSHNAKLADDNVVATAQAFREMEHNDD